MTLTAHQYELSEQQLSAMSTLGIPERMQGCIIRYYENKIPPGHFLTAVINNDLRDAVERADNQNINLLKAYVMWFYNWAPSESWGYEGAANRWLESQP